MKKKSIEPDCSGIYLVLSSGASPNNQFKYCITLDYLKEAIQHMDLGEGTSRFPIPFDSFINTTNLDSIPWVGPFNGGSLSMTLHDDTGVISPGYNAQLHYCYGRSLDKDGNSPNKSDWLRYFNFSNQQQIDGEVVVSIDGSLWVMADPNLNSCSIPWVPVDPSPPTEEMYIKYSAVLSLDLIDKPTTGTTRKYYFVIDPLVKISSNN